MLFVCFLVCMFVVAVFVVAISYCCSFVFWFVCCCSCWSFVLFVCFLLGRSIEEEKKVINCQPYI